MTGWKARPTKEREQGGHHLPVRVSDEPQLPFACRGTPEAPFRRTDMTKATRILAKVTYAVMGAAFLAAGASTLLVNTGLLPDAVRDLILRFSQNNLGMLHVIQELGSLLVLTGLVTLWCVWNYEQSRALHWMLTLYWAIM